jgi:hypothetical protein
VGLNFCEITFAKLVRQLGTAAWYSSLKQQLGTAAWYSSLVQQLGTRFTFLDSGKKWGLRFFTDRRSLARQKLYSTTSLPAWCQYVSWQIDAVWQGKNYTAQPACQLGANLTFFTDVVWQCNIFTALVVWQGKKEKLYSTSRQQLARLQQFGMVTVWQDKKEKLW